MLASLRWTWTAMAFATALASAPPEAPPAAAPAGLIQGTVILKRHSPVIGAAVLVRREDSAGRIDVTSTDSKGAFKVDSIPDGSYRVEILREGFRTVVKEAIVVRSPFRAVVEIVMEPEAASSGASSGAATGGAAVRVTGVVSAKDSGPKAEVRVRLSGSGEARSALTAADGSFAFDGVASGSHRLEVLGAGYIPIRVAVDLAADASIVATLVPQPPNYAPDPADLLPPEEPIPPPSS